MVDEWKRPEEGYISRKDFRRYKLQETATREEGEPGRYGEDASSSRPSLLLFLFRQKSLRDMHEIVWGEWGGGVVSEEMRVVLNEGNKDSGKVVEAEKKKKSKRASQRRRGRVYTPKKKGRERKGRSSKTTSERAELVWKQGEGGRGVAKRRKRDEDASERASEREEAGGDLSRLV